MNLWAENDIVLFWKNCRAVEVEDLWSFNFLEQCTLLGLTSI